MSGADLLRKLAQLLPGRVRVGLTTRGEILHDRPQIGDSLQRLIARGQLHAKTMLVRPTFVELFQNLRGRAVPAIVHVRPRQIVAQLADRVVDRLLSIGRRRLDVSECDQLLDRLLRLHRVELHVRRMQAGLARHIIPTRDRLDPRRIAKRFENRPTVHVLAHRQAKQREQRRRDVEQIDAVQQLVVFDARPGHHQDAKVAVLERRPRRLGRNPLRPQVIGMEAVVRHQNHRRLRPRHFHERVEHHVVVAVAGLDDAAIQLEVALVDVLLPRRMVTHEAVAEVIDRVEVHRHEVPRPVLHQPRGHRVDARAFGQNLSARSETMVLLLVDLCRTRHERQNVLGQQLVRIESQRGERLGELRRMHGPGRHRPGIFRRTDRLLKMVRDHRAANRLGRVRRPPTDHVAGEPFCERMFQIAFVLRERFVTGRIAAPSGVGSGNRSTPCLNGRLPVAIEVHSIGESTGCSVARLAIVPRSTSRATVGIFPASSSG